MDSKNLTAAVKEPIMLTHHFLQVGWRTIGVTIFLVICSMILLVDRSHSEEAVKVLIVPFEINGPEVFAYLDREIPNAVGGHLSQEGAELVPLGIDPAITKKTVREGDAAVRNLGMEKGADFVITGSLTLAEQAYSLHALLVDSSTDEKPTHFTQEGEGTEYIPGAIDQLARDISQVIFKREIIAEVSITGNQRIDSDTIRRAISAVPGEIYVPRKIPEDIKAIYDMGYFDDIKADVRSAPEGKSILFTVEEKPTVRQVLISGNKVLEAVEIVEVVDITSGSILNSNRIQENVEAIKHLYADRNYHNAEITYSVRPLRDNQADLVFAVKEGKKLLIREIKLEGNVSYTDGALKDVMKTSEKGTFSWLTGSGNLKTEQLIEDGIRLQGHYRRNGYTEARVSEPAIEFRDRWIYITIEINEGPRLKVGRVDIAGDLIQAESQMLGLIDIHKETYVNEEVMQADALILEDLYGDQGYAYVKVTPVLGKAGRDNRSDVSYHISKGKKVYLEKIEIAGNTKTRDNIIRREIVLEEGDLHSGKKLKESIRNLHQLGLFEDVAFETSEGSDDDKMAVKVDVKEGQTSAFFFGGAYSEVDDFYGQLAFEERNLFGRGQHLRLIAQTSKREALYQLSFYEPWVFDSLLSAGFEIYSIGEDYDFYEAILAGVILRTGYRIAGDTRVLLGYKYETDSIETLTYWAPQTVFLVEDSTINSSIAASIQYDSVDNPFNPTKGYLHAFTVEYAGLGGDVGYTKCVAETGGYWPLYRRLVFFAHAEGGLIEEISDLLLPDYERFYLGGIDSLRGYDWRDLSPIQRNPFGFESYVGGKTYVQFNFELLLPITEQAGIHLLAFYDAGDVYGDGESVDLGNLRQSVGLGFRWISPMGPIRLEYAYPLDTEPGDLSDGHFEFTIGYPFRNY